MTSIDPLPYLVEIRQYLKTRECDAWKWFARHQTAEKQVEKLKFDLLTSTYRLDRANESEKTLYEAADSIRDRLGIDAPITLYQAPESSESNARIFSSPNEIHIVLSGSLRKNLTSNEFKALFAHELGHHLLDMRDDNEYRNCWELLLALSHDERFGDTYLETCRLTRLYTELYCDRIALEILGKLDDVVSMFVKVYMGQPDVSAASYIKQSDEIFAGESSKSLHTAGVTHPEMFIRVRSLRLWSEKKSGEEIASIEKQISLMIEGEPDLEELDLLARDRLCVLTREMIDAFLEPEELQSELTLAHAKQFFSDYEPPKADKKGSETDFSIFPVKDDSLRDYWCYLFLDFVTADRDLRDESLKQAEEFAKKLKIGKRFTELANKELADSPSAKPVPPSRKKKGGPV